MIKETLHIQNWLRNGAILGRPDGQYSLSEGPFGPLEPKFRGSLQWLMEGFFFSHNEDLRWEVGQKDFSWTPEALEKYIFNENNLSSQPQGGVWNEPDFNVFKTQFDQAKNLLSDGKIKKIVPIAVEWREQNVNESTILHWIQSALKSNTSGSLFGKWNEQEGILGLTPEILFNKWRPAELQTMALAGTAKNDSHALLKDSKEVDEHNIVIDEIIAQLSPLGEVTSGATYEWAPGSLKHLRTDIELKNSKEESPDVFIKSLHPTPALGGSPRKESLEILKQWNKRVPRDLFGAPFGYKNDKNQSTIVVAIRCLIWKSNKVFVASGCGLVKESQIDREWMELKAKRNAVKKVFGLQYEEC